MSDKKTTIIESRDFYGDQCLGDGINFDNTQARRPKGEVLIFEEDENGVQKLVHKNNLVVYSGREILAQRLVNLENTNVTGTKDEYISWFGLGDGGVRPADPLDPTPPITTDEYLYSPIPVSDATGSVYADFHTAGDTTPAGGSYPATGSYVKRFDTNGIEFSQDVLNDSKYLVIQITTTIGVSDANGYQLSEAGLFTAESNVGGYSGNFTLFARVTFPSLIKTVDRRLIFVWYLYV
jgi:hypothetical protein